MGHPQRLRHIRLVIRGLLVLLCIFAIPKLASSEADTPKDQDVISSKRPKVIHQGGGYPVRATSRIFPDNNDCATAKIDLWFQRGAVTHSVSLANEGLHFRGPMRSAEGATTFLVGGKDCLIRVRIQPVSAGTSVHD
jgi:hypothetical protein